MFGIGKNQQDVKNLEERLQSLEERVAAVEAQMRQSNAAPTGEQPSSTPTATLLAVPTDTSSASSADSSATDSFSDKATVLMADSTSSVLPDAFLPDASVGSSNDDASPEPQNPKSSDEDLLPVELPPLTIATAPSPHTDTGDDAIDDIDGIDAIDGSAPLLPVTADDSASTPDTSDTSDISLATESSDAPAAVSSAGVMDDASIGGIVSGVPSPLVLESSKVAADQPAITEPAATDTTPSVQQVPDISSATTEEPMQAVIAQIADADAAEFARDRAQYETALAESDSYAESAARLQTCLTQTGLQMTNTLRDAAEIAASAPEGLKENLDQRLRGVQLIITMTNRALQRIEEETAAMQKPPLLPADTLPRCLPDALKEATRDCGDPGCAQKKGEALRQSIGQTRYESVRLALDQARSGYDYFRRFVERQILPILDGIDDGEKFSREEIVRWRSSYSDFDAAKLDDFLATYTVFRHMILQPLGELQVAVIPARTGDPIDFERFEPFDTEEDKNLPDSTIKSVVRNGYVWGSQQGGTPRNVVLRSAQVVVVRNNA